MKGKGYETLQRITELADSLSDSEIEAAFRNSLMCECELCRLTREILLKLRELREARIQDGVLKLRELREARIKKVKGN